MAIPSGPVVPKPQIPKTLGILNIIFGVLLFLYGTCSGVMLVATPYLVQMSKKMVEDVQAKADAQRKDAIKNLDAAEKAAKSDAEKKQIQSQRELIKSAPRVPAMPDMQESLAAVNDPTIRTFSLIQLGTGIVMNIALIVAGIGLVRLRPWGRSLSIGLSGIQLVRLLILCIISIVVIVPLNKQYSDRMFAKLEAQAKAQGAAPGAALNLQTIRATSDMGSVFVVGYLVIGSIYPIISLILLNTAAARAACRDAKPPGEPEYL